MSCCAAGHLLSGSDPAAEYGAARKGAVLADLAERGRLEISGADALDLMHRLTTNAVRDLGPGEGRPAIFATAKGRIIDLVIFHRIGGRLLCTTGDGRAGVVASWIERYTIREDVRVENRSPEERTLGIYGARSAEVASTLAGAAASGWPPHHAEEFDCEGIPGVLARTDPMAGDGYLAIVETGRAPALAGLLRDRFPWVRIAGPATLEVLRIEAGLPAPGSELTEEYNPWEARLADAVALDKGCYVGQEVIARLKTYDKVSKYLVRLDISGARTPAPGSALEVKGRRSGVLTSAAIVPGEGRIIGLGYVQDEHAEGGMEIDIAAPGGRIGAVILGFAR